jgi:hypothetical protein
MKAGADGAAKRVLPVIESIRRGVTTLHGITAKLKAEQGAESSRRQGRIVSILKRRAIGLYPPPASSHQLVT